jgi:glycosyltransferase involved in cell wall biosynthesis
MTPIKIAMLVTNPYRPDPRVQKEAQSLSQAGYDVTIICWDRANEFPEKEIIQGIKLQRIKITSQYHAGNRQLYYLPRFWFAAIQLLGNLKPDIIHCHDLDTTFVGAFFAYWHKIPWIFDAHECYPEQISSQVNRLIYYFLKWFERFMAKKSDHVITVGNSLANHFRSFGCNVTVVGNYPKLEAIISVEKEISREKLGIPDNTIVVSYIGGFTQARVILPLIYTTDMDEKLTILLAGDGIQRAKIEEEIKSRERIIYLGWIKQEQVPAYTALSDIIYYGINKTDGNSQFSAPNTLFNSMAAGKPILTTDVGEIAAIIKSENCGVVIPDAIPEHMLCGINQLKDPSVRLNLGNNGKKAAFEKYNWENAQKGLIQVYSSLLNR